MKTKSFLYFPHSLFHSIDSVNKRVIGTLPQTLKTKQNINSQQGQMTRFKASTIYYSLEGE